MCPATGEAVRLLPFVTRRQGRSGGKPQVPGLFRPQTVGKLVRDGANGHTGWYADSSSQVITNLFFGRATLGKVLYTQTKAVYLQITLIIVLEKSVDIFRCFYVLPFVISLQIYREFNLMRMVFINGFWWWLRHISVVSRRSCVTLYGWSHSLVLLKDIKHGHTFLADIRATTCVKQANFQQINFSL